MNYVGLLTNFVDDYENLRKIRNLRRTQFNEELEELVRNYAKKINSQSDT